MSDSSKHHSEYPVAIDLFSGAGGLSLGAARAGFRIAAAVEMDKHAVETHSRNFPNTVHVQRDAAGIGGYELLKLSGLQFGELDSLIGGPPCQGFSMIGQRNEDDYRNTLFTHFFRLVDEMRPKFFLAENVPGILCRRFDNIREKAFELVRPSYQLLPPIAVRANEYGAPTNRKRIFFIGYNPDHFRRLTEEDFAPQPDIEKVKVRRALAGLPRKISPEWQAEAEGWRRARKMADSAFASKVCGEIPEGVGDPESIERYKLTNSVSGCLGTRHSEEVAARYHALDYGRKDNISKSVRLAPTGYCPTLRAGTGSDRGSYQAVRPIHPYEARVITPREAARLQGFPDWFVLHPTKWHSFRQIGNSVSPIVAESLMKVFLSKILRCSIAGNIG